MASIVAALEAGDYYSALQRCRALAVRKLDGGREVEAVNLLLDTCASLSGVGRLSEAVDLSTLLLQKVLAPTSAARPFSQPALRLCAALMALLVSPALVVSAAADEADALTRSAAVMSWINSLLAWSAAAVKSVPAPLAAQWRPSVQAFEATLHAAAARLYAAVVTRSISDAAAAASGGSEVPFSEGVATAVQQAIRHYCAAGDAQEVPSADSATWRLDAPLPRADAAAAALAPPTDAPALGALSANMMHEFARFLGVCIAHMHVTEADAVLAGCVLRLAAAGNLRDANALRGSVLDMYDSAEAGGATRKAAIAKVLRDSPLSHFVKFLLLTLERDAPALFKTLCDKYAPSLERDPAYEQYIQAIGLRYYKIQPPQSGLACLMSNMMGMFGGGMPPMGGGAGGSAAGALPPNPFAALMR